jgi:uncharacterized membrane protein YhhN
MIVSLVTAIFRNFHKERGRLASKLTASLLFCAIGLVAATMRTDFNVRAAWLLAALLLGGLGDVLLGLDHFVVPERQSFLFLIGGAPFFIGHIIYVVLLLSYGSFSPFLFLLIPFVPLLFLSLHLGKVFDLGRSLPFLLLYGTMLSVMLLSTFAVATQGGNIGKLMIFPGILFTISDTALFLNRFGSKRASKIEPALSFLIMLPYYAAQSLFAISVLYI